MTASFKILIADDHSVIRSGISLIIKQLGFSSEIDHVSNFTGLISKLHGAAFDLIVLDISIPEGKGVMMIEQIKSLCPKTRILIFSAHPEELYAVKYLRSGADGYLNKMTNDNGLYDAFNEIILTGKYISKNSAYLLDNADLNQAAVNPFFALSARELEIAKLLVKGEGNLEIANQLDLQNSTVSTYKSRIFEKLSIKSTIALANVFETYGAI